MQFKLNTIEEAIDEIKNGRVVIVVDDENRENEGDFLTAASNITPEIINFMVTHGRGLVCAPIIEDRCDELGLELMVQSNSAAYETPFTVSIDLIGHGCTTGISVQDRAKTIKALVNNTTKPQDLGRPGHIFPLRAKNGGVLRRTGHTEAAVDFARLAGFEAAGILVEILNEDGTMARLPHLVEVARKFDLKLVSIEDLVAYRMRHDSLIVKREEFEVETRFGHFTLHAYQQTTNEQVHLALTKGNWELDDPVLTRINSTLVNNDILGTLTHNADKKLDDMFKALNEAGKGAIVFIEQQSQSYNILKRLKGLQENQKNGIIKAPKIEMDTRDFGIGAQILHDLNITKMRLMTNSDQAKRVGIVGYGLEIVDYSPY